MPQPEELFALSQAQSRKLDRLLQWWDSAGQLQRQRPQRPLIAQNLQFVEITSTTATAGKYPAKWWQDDPATGNWTVKDVVWARFTTSATPQLGVLYPALERGADASDVPIFVIVERAGKDIQVLTAICPVRATGSTGITIWPITLTTTPTTLLLFTLSMTNPAPVIIHAHLYVNYASKLADANKVTGTLLVDGVAQVLDIAIRTDGSGCGTKGLILSASQSWPMTLTAGTHSVELDGSCEAGSGGAITAISETSVSTWVATTLNYDKTPVSIPGGSEGTTVEVCPADCTGCSSGSGSGSGGGGSIVATFLGSATTGSTPALELKKTVTVKANTLLIAKVTFIGPDAFNDITFNGISMSATLPFLLQYGLAGVTGNVAEFYYSPPADTTADIDLTALMGFPFVAAIEATQVAGLVNNAPDKVHSAVGYVSQPDSGLSAATATAKEYVSGGTGMANPSPGLTWIWQGTTTLPDGQDVSISYLAVTWWLTGGHAVINAVQQVNAQLGGINATAAWAGYVATYK